MKPVTLEQILEAFGGKILKTRGTIAAYQAKYPGKVPDSTPPNPFKRKPRARMDNSEWWNREAIKIQHRNFSMEPIDDSTKESLMIGFRGCGTPACLEAIEKLKQVKVTKWGKEDLAAGKLLPRTKKKGMNHDNHD